jgi:hypothetical protein
MKEHLAFVSVMLMKLLEGCIVFIIEISEVELYDQRLIAFLLIKLLEKNLLLYIVMYIII